MNALFLYLNRELILSKITQEEIFTYYFGVRIEFGKFYKNPLRADKTPSCKFYYDNGILKFNDISRDKIYDCIDIVKEKFNLNYRQALKKIYTDLILQKQEIKVSKECEIKRVKNKTKHSFKSSTRKFRPKELDFWSIDGMTITEDVLNHYGIYASHTIWEKEWIYEDTQMCFSYVEGKKLTQVYFPQNKGTTKRRFINASDFILGGLPWIDKNANHVLITKSRKDWFYCKLFGINALYVINEKIILDSKIMNVLKRKYNNVLTLFDDDKTGLHLSWVYRKNYSTIPLTISCNEGKDFSGCLKQFGYQYMIDLIQEIKQKLSLNN